MSPGRAETHWASPQVDHGAAQAGLGALIRHLRTDAGLSQRELGELVGTTQSAIARLENGQTEPRLTTLAKLATALDSDLLVHVGPAGGP